MGHLTDDDEASVAAEPLTHYTRYYINIEKIIQRFHRDLFKLGSRPNNPSFPPFINPVSQTLSRTRTLHEALRRHPRSSRNIKLVRKSLDSLLLPFHCHSKSCPLPSCFLLVYRRPAERGVRGRKSTCSPTVEETHCIGLPKLHFFFF